MIVPRSLGPLANVAWAKSDVQTGTSLPLHVHLTDTANVATLLWDTFTADSVKQVVVRNLEANHDPVIAGDLARKLFTFLAASHDIGKLSPAFLSHAPHLNAPIEALGLRCPAFRPAERRNAHHSIVSAVSLTEWLIDKFPNMNRRKAQPFACILGGHHGRFPNFGQLENGRDELPTTGSEPQWRLARDELFEFAQSLADLTDVEFAQLLDARLDQASQVILTALLIQADWIASNVDLFPYDTASSAGERASHGIELLDLPEPWHPVPSVSPQELFTERFDLPPGAALRPVQLSAMQMAADAQTPGLIIIEAPTGEGKTEAAFAAAEILAAKFGCGGVIVALPTQATTNAMFTRTLTWLRRSVASEQPLSINLVHGKAQFNADFEDLTDQRVRQIFDQNDTANNVVAHWWLTGRKKAVLADFVVSTIDQVLLAALSSKHVVLRHLGLAGKVVILDEIHACDEYMLVYLERALQWLGALQVPVIALSATLPPQIRSRLLSAYRSGKRTNNELSLPHAEGGYPLVSSSWGETTACVPSGRSQSTLVEYVTDSDDVAELALSMCRDGGVIAIVHNTVRRAQETFIGLRDQLGDDVLLLHSRFVAADRLQTEQRLLSALGPNGKRPRRLVVVATQVIEQSLDVDFDAMICDFAPMDALIQRMGRIHRHARPASARPSALATPVLKLTGVTQSQSVPEFDSGSEYVYGRKTLLATKAVLDEHLRLSSCIESPTDVPRLVAATYSDDIAIPASWQTSWQEALAEHSKLIGDQKQRAEVSCISPPGPTGALYGWANVEYQQDSDSLAPAVRDIKDSIEVIVVVRGTDGRVRTLPWLAEHGNELVDFQGGIDETLAKATARCVASLPSWLASGQLGDQVIAELESNFIASWQQSRWLRGELPLILDDHLECSLAGQLVRYDPQVGLTIERIVS